MEMKRSGFSFFSFNKLICAILFLTLKIIRISLYSSSLTKSKKRKTLNLSLIGIDMSFDQFIRSADFKLTILASIIVLINPSIYEDMPNIIEVSLL